MGSVDVATSAEVRLECFEPVAELRGISLTVRIEKMDTATVGIAPE